MRVRGHRLRLVSDETRSENSMYCPIVTKTASHTMKLVQIASVGVG